MNLNTIHFRINKLAPWMLVLSSAVVAAVIYFGTLHAQFVSDDDIYLVRNVKLLGLQFSQLWRLFVEPYNPLEFLPLRDLSYWFDISLFGMDPAAFRLHNIILYLLCLPLVYANTAGLWRYFRPVDSGAAQWAAAVVTVLFALHPAHVEAVVWISGRKDVLSCFFSLLAMWFAVNTKLEQGYSSRYAVATLFALLAAMLSKATAVAVAPVIALLWITFWRDAPKQDRHPTLLLWPFACLILAASVAVIFTANSSVKEPDYFGIELLARALAILGWLARLAVTPENRQFFYLVLDDPHQFVMAAMGVAVMAAAVASGVMLLRKRSLEGFALIAFVLLCLPYLQLIPYKTFSLASDRFIALAVWPVMLLLVALSWRLSRVPRMALLFAIALPWVFQTVERSYDWRSEVALIDKDVQAYPGQFMPIFLRITIQMSERSYQEAAAIAGRISDPEVRNVTLRMIEATYAVRINAIRTRRPEEAIDALQKLGSALKMVPAQYSWNPSVAYVWQYTQDIFSKQWGHLIDQFPDDALVRYKAGLWKLDAKDYDAAATHLRAAIESQSLPESLRGEAYRNLGVALLDGGHAAEAELPLRFAVQQFPPDFQADCILADVYKLIGRVKDAEQAEGECRSHVSRETSAH